MNCAANLYLISLSPCHNIKCGNVMKISCAIFHSHSGDVYFHLGAEARRHLRLVSVRNHLTSVPLIHGVDMAI